MRYSIILTLLAAAMPLAAETQSYDVVVVGGSSGGIGAAIGAARLGVSVALVEDTPVLGGMISNGISNIDSYSYESQCGLFEEFREEVRKHYEPLFGKDPFFKLGNGMPPHINGRSFAAHESLRGGRWEPHVADAILKRKAAELPNLKIFYKRFATKAVMEGNRITGVATETDAGEPILFTAKVVVDATHEADVAASAGAPFRKGREARSALEPHAGKVHFFNHTGEFLPGSTGEGDEAMVSSGLRLCIKNYPKEAGEAHVMTEPPPGYAKEKYIHSAYRGTPGVPHGKSEMNTNPIGSELQLINWNWAESDRAGRRKIYETYRNNALGFLYYLQHERGFRHLGLPDDEFKDNGNVPYRIYIRESRRIEGDDLMTEADINPFINGNGLIPPLRKNSIGIGEYPIDSKPVRPKSDLTTPDKGEGDFYLVNASIAFQVPYGSLLPQKTEGLLVPVALSATHVAFSSIRMDPTWMSLGQSAGIAAAMSVKKGTPPRMLPLEELQKEMVGQKLKIAFYWDVEGTHPAFAEIQLLSAKGVVDGNADRCFRPDEPLTRAEAARFIFRAFGLWTSVSNVHFTDVPHTHPAFREIETLFDNGAMPVFGIDALWPKEGGYDAKQHSGFRQKNNIGEFKPDQPVTEAELSALIGWFKGRTNQSDRGDRAPLLAPSEAPAITRGEACRTILAALPTAHSAK
ncbi:FAD-dependent oxidoreductase [Luteolibacter sp. SL250]|uniref:FAD-dependent oxidoreductase n=1 Tax=Luteolibacter sp. SL250 TaxID=2995170 RepID=UPI00226E2D15|nr:FAD-dependent oxidoreductase [Luteolibacter sp. SL250]WAC20152.1 FAD-dependent oxidoreductase [Luteolibacter sp. SL250]